MALVLGFFDEDKGRWMPIEKSLRGRGRGHDDA